MSTATRWTNADTGLLTGPHQQVDPANIVAELDNGVLTVRVPKAAKAMPQRIAVRAVDSAIHS